MSYTKVAAIFADGDALSGKEITVAGWAKTIRDMKTFGFIELNDGSCFRNLQVVADASILSNYKEIVSQNVGAALSVTGTVVLTPDAKQPLELKAATINVEGTSTPDYPLQKKRHSVEYLRTIQHLRPRTNLFSATFRVRSVAAYAVHEFFQNRGFVYTSHPHHHRLRLRGRRRDVPRHHAGSRKPPRTEDGSVDYSQDFFGKATNLTVSGQLNAENFRHGLRRRLHLRPHLPGRELQHRPPCRRVLDDRAGDGLLRSGGRPGVHGHGEVHHQAPCWKNARRRWSSSTISWTRVCSSGCSTWQTSDFGRVSYTEAVDLLIEAGHKFDYPVEWGIDLQTEHERYLTEEIFKRPVFVTDYPKEIKAFYMRLNDDGKTVAAADCLVPGIGEIIGGSQREERLDVLERA
jgi:asparaginyl-tRNA synthetase